MTQKPWCNCHLDTKPRHCRVCAGAGDQRHGAPESVAGEDRGDRGGGGAKPLARRDRVEGGHVIAVNVREHLQQLQVALAESALREQEHKEAKAKAERERAEAERDAIVKAIRDVELPKPPSVKGAPS